MNRKGLYFAVAMLSSLSPSSAAQVWDSRQLPASLDKLSANAWQPSLLTAFGTFTYADSALPSPFSRFLEDGLKSAMTQSFSPQALQQIRGRRDGPGLSRRSTATFSRTTASTPSSRGATTSRAGSSGPGSS